MSEILKFPNSDHMKPIHESLDLVLTQLGIPAEFREEAVAWMEQEAAHYQVPDLALSITLPDGITDEQAEHLRREIHREFSKYHRALFAAKHEYIIQRVRQRLVEFLRAP